jgi:hypothetical protein
VHSSTDVELQQKPHHHTSISSTNPAFENQDGAIHSTPSFHRHAEATTAELFYDLFFVANLTTFTSMLEINDSKSLTAYVGFFSLLWLTWYQTSLYDVRFSTDSVFERVAKAVHFGVMVGFAVIGPQWKPGQEIPTGEYKIYKAFGLMLMVSRITLFCQYGVTLFYARVHKKTRLPLMLVMAWTLLAAILYGALAPIFPKEERDPVTDEELVRKSDVYIAWYLIAISETVLTVVVSCVWRIISFKGTHMIQVRCPSTRCTGHITDDGPQSACPSSRSSSWVRASSSSANPSPRLSRTNTSGPPRSSARSSRQLP